MRLGTSLPPYEKAETASYVIYKQGNVIYAKNGETGAVEFSGTDAATVIQQAIDALTSGGKIFIKAGTYTLTNSLTLKPGVSIEGVFPRRKNIEPGAPDGSAAVIEGGTVFEAASSDIVALTGNNLIGVELRNLAFKGFKRAMEFGAKDTLGMAFSRLENIYIDNSGDVAIKITNFQHLRLSHIKAVIPANTRFMHLVNDHYNWAGGNSVFDDLYVVGGGKADGVILFQAINLSLNLVEVIRPQVNMWGSDGVGSGIRLLNETGDSSGMARINLYGVDVEGNPEAAVKLEGARNSFILISYTDATYSAQLKSYGGVVSMFNTLAGIVSKVYCETWENFVITPYTATIEGSGIYGLVTKTNPSSGNLRPALLIGSKTAYFDDHYAPIFPGVARGTATITAGNTYVDVPHGLGAAFNISKVRITPRDDLGGRSFWVEEHPTDPATYFRIYISSTDTVDHTFNWYAEA